MLKYDNVISKLIFKKVICEIIKCDLGQFSLSACLSLLVVKLEEWVQSALR
jgi:hypothetical protein